MAQAIQRLTTQGSGRVGLLQRRRSGSLAYARIQDVKLRTVGKRRVPPVAIDASITGAQIEHTIEGASTLTITVEDPDKRLLLSSVLTAWAWGDAHGDERAWLRYSQAVDVRVGTVWFRLVKVSKSGTSLTLTFEERSVTYLRRHKGARSASRSKMTRAQFVKLLVSEVKASGGVPLFAPELRVKQPIGKAAEAKTRDERDEDGEPGLEDDAKLDVKGEAANDGQLRLIERVLSAAESHNPTPKAFKALVMACIVESLFQNGASVRHKDLDSRGVLQVRDSTARGMGIDPEDVEECVAAFLKRGFWGKGGAIALARRNTSQSAGWIAQQVQGSAHPSRYSEYADEAEAILRAWNGGGGRVQSYTKQYRYKRGKDETTWDASGRLAEEVAWRRFMRRGRLWFVSEEYLFRQRPVYRLVEGEGGVDQITYDLDLFARGANPVSEVSVSLRAGRWSPLPGTVVRVAGEGPVDGRWLVVSVIRDLYDDSGLCEVKLRKPIPKLPEPASERVQRDQDDQGDPEESGGSDSVKAACQAISAKGYPYVWGGGHAKAGTPDGGDGSDRGIGYDCSGSVAAALVRAGVGPLKKGDSVPASGTMASWGKAGKGREFTLYANARHVFLQGDGWRFDTGGPGGGNGPRFHRQETSTVGFTARHF